MKRRRFLQGLALVPPLLLGGCKKDEPTPPTIFTGYVIDENDKPMSGVEFVFGATKLKGISYIPTFNVSGFSDINGVYFLEKIIPENSENIYFKVFGNFKNLPGYGGEYFCLINGNYQLDIPWKSMQKNEVNFKYKK